MFRKIGFGAVAALTVGVLAVGCSEDGDTFITGGTLVTDNFPGSQIQNVADDQRAFSIQGQEYQDDAAVFWNVSNGSAIGMFTTMNNNTGQISLWASYKTPQGVWSAPVQIRGQDTDATEEPTSSVNGFKVCWINTAGSSVPEVAARNGDAVILFTRPDQDPNDPTATSEEDSNNRLWMTYFSLREANAPAANGVVRGFTVAAITVDDDNTITGGDDPDVSDFGVVSTSLKGTHSFGAGTDEVDSGEPTDSLNIVYRKDPASGTGIGDRYLAKAVIGDAPTNDLASLLDTQETLAPATNALATGESVNSGFVVHNELMFWNHTTVVAGDTETPATVTQFDSDGVVDEVALGESVIDNDVSDVVELPDPSNVFGGDHQLAKVVVLFRQIGFTTDNSPATGEAANDADFFVGGIDLDASLAVERVKVDNFADTIDTGTAGTAAARVGRDITNIQSRINRTGEYITVLFNQQNTDASTDVDLDPINTNNLLYVTVIQTRKVSSTGTTPARDLADSVYDDDAGTTTIYEPLQVPSQVSSGLTTTATGIEGDVENADFQIELAQGQAVSQSGALLEPSCGIQANAYRMNFVYTQLVDGAGNSGTGTDEERLLVNGIEVDLGDTETDAPAVTLVDTTEELVATRDTGYGRDFDAFAADAGDSSRDNTGAPDGDSGRVLVFYVLNANNPADDSVSGAFGESRAFVWDAGTSELLSTDGAREFDQVAEFSGAGAITVPVDRTATHHAGTTLHVLWSELVDNGPAVRIVTRSYSKGAINDGSTANDALENRFTPNLVGGTAGASPVAIDNPTDGDVGQLELALLRQGTTVALIFDEDGHGYYTDTSTDALGWDMENGIPAPQLIDNDAFTGLGGQIEDLVVASFPDCENLGGSIVAFTRRELQSGNNDERLFVRVHD